MAEAGWAGRSGFSTINDRQEICSVLRRFVWHRTFFDCRIGRLTDEKRMRKPTLRRQNAVVVRAFAGNLARCFEEELMFSITSWVRSFISCWVEWRGLEKRAARGREKHAIHDCP